MKAFWLNYPNVKNRVDLHQMLLLQRQPLPLPIASTEWMEACGLPQNGVNWTAAYQLASKRTRSTKLREFQFNFCTGDCQQLTFGLTLTNKGNPRCSFFFKEEQEKLTPFLELPYNKIFLGNVIARLNCGFPGRSKQFSLADITLAIGLRPASSKLHQHVNFCLLRARHYIWLGEKSELTLTLYGYLKYVNWLKKKWNMILRLSCTPRWLPSQLANYCKFKFKQAK